MTPKYPSRSLRTTDDFEALPLGTVIRCDDAEGIGMNVAEKHAGGWVYVGSSLEFPSSALAHDEVDYAVLFLPVRAKEVS